MQLVIEISDGLYNNLGTIKNGSIASKIILDCVRKGQVLPKRHGRLIDADKVENITWQEPYYHDALNVLTEVRDKVRELPTIIKADKEEE